MIRLFPILILLGSCATSTIYRDGKPIAVLQCDAEALTITQKTNGETTITARRINHSIPTEAQGRQFAAKATAAGSAAAGIGLGILAK